MEALASEKQGFIIFRSRISAKHILSCQMAVRYTWVVLLVKIPAQPLLFSDV